MIIFYDAYCSLTSKFCVLKKHLLDEKLRGKIRKIMGIVPRQLQNDNAIKIEEESPN